MTKIEKCPRCGKPGSLHTRYVLNSQKRRFEPYEYIAHYNTKQERSEASMQGKKLSQISWCYLPKRTNQTLSNLHVEKALDEDRAQKYLDFLEASVRET